MTKKSFSITSAILVTLSLSLAQGGVKTQTAAESAKDTLKQLRASAIKVENEAEELTVIIENPLMSAESHLDRLTAMKEDINRMGREIGSLEEERQALATWEREAVDKVLPLAQDAAANTQSAIEFFNNNRNDLWADGYRDEAQHVRQDSEQIAKLLGSYLRDAKNDQAK